MQLIYKQNPNYKLYAGTFIEIRQSGIEQRQYAPVDIVVDGKPFNTGRIERIVTKQAKDITDTEALLAFGVGYDEALSLLGKIYRTPYPHLMNVDVMIITQDQSGLERKFTNSQAQLF